MRAAIDLINISLSDPLDGDILERVWRGNDASFKHLRVFDCWVSVHIPHDKRFKLDSNAKQCIFLG